MKKTIVIALHLAYWLCYLLVLFVTVLLTNPLGGYKAFFKNIFWSPLGTSTLVPAIIAFYGSYFFLLPLLRARRHRYFFAGILGLTALACVFTTLMLSLTTKLDFVRYNVWSVLLEMQAVFAVLSIIHLSTGLILGGFIQWYGDIRIKEELARKNVETELALIKAQLDPHFLFNTLNNIDVLIEKDPGKASEYLHRLSEMMRFMLYETKTETIPLERELHYVRQYVELQRIRTPNPDFASLNILGETKGVQIAPMIFIPFIENAFKHAPPVKQGRVVDIQLKVEEERLEFKCVNPLKPEDVAIGPKGLGNELISRRLNLLYENRHELKIDRNEGEYTVELIISRP